MTDPSGYSAVAGHNVPKSGRLRRALWIVVAVLGAASLAMSIGAGVPIDFPVRLSVSAAIVAAVGLLPRQAERGWIVEALAATAFLDSLATWLTADEPHWTSTVVMVLNALQAAVALAALLHDTAGPGSADSDDRQNYSAYARAAAAYTAYAMGYQQASMAPYGAAGQATARAEADAKGRHAAAAPGDAAHDSSTALQARYTRYGMSEGAQHSPGTPDTPVAGTDPGVPAADHVIPQTYPYQGQWQDPSGVGSANGTHGVFGQ